MKIVLIAVSFVLMTSGLAVSKEVVTNDNRILEISWKEKNEDLKVWGKVRKGKSCRNLYIDVVMQNKRTGERAYIEDLVQDYNARVGARFSGIDRVWRSDSSTDRKYWRVYRWEDRCK